MISMLKVMVGLGSYLRRELEVIKKYKKQDEKVAVVSCKLGGNAEKKLGRNDINVEGYGGS